MALQVEIDGAVATVTIDPPPTNLVDGPFFVALLDMFGRLEADESVRVAMFRSADPDCFAMHGDAHMLRDHRLIPSAELEHIGQAVARRIAAMPADAVAAVKRVVDATADAALVVESDAVSRLLATGAHRPRMDRFVAAGGQTCEAEIMDMQTILDAVLED